MHSDANAEQIHNWNDLAGPRWTLRQATLDAELDSFGLAAMATLGELRGRSVMDVGCGCGATSLQLADRVGRDGSVTGVDVSTVMLARARERASAFSNVAFVEADAQVAQLPQASYNAIFSRFGVMFFSDPVAAFTNLRRSLVPGGRLAFICWQSLSDNPWMSVSLRAVLTLGLPQPEYAVSDAPGPFAFASQDRVRRVLAGSGFSEIAVSPCVTDILVGGSADFETAVDSCLQMGPTAFALRDASSEQRQAARDAVQNALRAHRGHDGVRLKGAAWIVTARSVTATLDGSAA